MGPARRLGTWTRKVLVGIALAVVVLIAVVGAILLAIQTPWGKNQLRNLAVRQANRALTATLSIGRLEGSLFSGVTVRDVRLTRNGRELVAIDAVSAGYNLREIWTKGIIVDSVHVVRPRVTATKEADGRWDLASLVREKAPDTKPKGPGRRIRLSSIVVDDGTIVLNTPVTFGAVHIPTRYEHLKTRLAFQSEPNRWTLAFSSMSWTGSDPNLTIDSLTGALGTGPHGFEFHQLDVRTPQTAFVVSGTIHNEQKPTAIDLDVQAERFDFQEWGGILRGLRNIAVSAGFDVSLHGPLTAMATNLRMGSTAGTINGKLTLNTQVPGWRGRGAVDIDRLNLAGWLNRRDRPSDITGHVVFDLALRLGEGFPEGRYDFRGSHAGFMEYAADNVVAHGDINRTQVFVREATARAYNADLTAAGTIALDDPFDFRFAGTMAGLDLRRVPKSVPIPHVDSRLSLDYDVRGRFAHPFIAGRARLAQSMFLGATIADGTIGTIDTSAHPITYSGDGAITNVDLGTFGEALDIATLREPRYQGRVAGRFKLDAKGTNAQELDLHASGRLFRAEVFDGTLSDADVTLDIANGTLTASYNGAFDRVNPSIPLADQRYASVLTGSGRVHTTIRDLMLRTTTAADYDIDADIAFGRSKVRGIDMDTGHFSGAFRDSLLRTDRLDVTGPVVTMHGAGALAFLDVGASDFSYTVDRADLAHVGTLGGYSMGGQLATTGKLTGPWASPHVSGHGSAVDLAAPGVYALTAAGDYDFDVPAGDPLDTTAHVVGNATFVKVGGQELQRAEANLRLTERTVTFDGSATQAPDRGGRANGRVHLAPDGRSMSVEALTLDVGTRWRLTTTNPRVAWDEGGVRFDVIELAGGVTGNERLSVSGDWRRAGGGEIHVGATAVHLESFQNSRRPPRYAGIVDADARITGTRDGPAVAGTVTVSNGRVDRFSYQRIHGRIDYSSRVFGIDFRIDEAPGVWATAVGKVPLSLFRRSLPDAPIDVRVTSSPIQLGLLNGVTSVITNLSGEALLDVHAIGTSHDPHFEGHVDVNHAAFVAATTGVAYNNVRAAFALARDRITVQSLHVEDTDHHPLDVSGSLATHELQVAALEIDAKAHEFTVIRNELGRVAVDADVAFSGRFESPVLEGDLSVTGGSLAVDDILERTLFRPYSTEETSISATDTLDPFVVLNPWDRLTLNLTLHVPETLRLTGSNVQIAPGTPIGIGDINLRVGGDLVLLKDPGQSLGIYGSFDTITGQFTFEGRRFTVEQTSSINFRGGLSPELYVNLTREISGIQANIGLTGPLTNPELHLSSTPPLEASDVLSLIVFNTTLNDLNAVQQQNLAVRAGTIAAGFLATPLVSTIQSRVGLDILEVSTTSDVTPDAVAPKVTIGEEIAPGLFARFSRQFGENEYNQVEIEYYLTRILQLRATFADAAALNFRSPFRRIERGGIDLLFFFSF